MKHEDKDLEKLLAPLRELPVEEFSLAKWQRAAAKAERAPSSTARRDRMKWAIQWAVAVMLGFVLGSVFQSRRYTETPGRSEYSQVTDATFEHSHANLDR